MEKFTTLTAVAAPLTRDNIDTDIILPAEVISRLGTDMSRIGDGMFHDWRFDSNGEPRPDFVLNQSRYADAKILVTGSNFGCGSSREHAVWTLLGYGFRCVIARSFGDIFFNNCFKKGLLPVALDEAAHGRLLQWVEESAGAVPMTVDLDACEIRLAGQEVIRFEIDPPRRDVLLQGLDEIGLTLRYHEDISAFQKRDRKVRPWAYDVDFLSGIETDRST